MDGRIAYFDNAATTFPKPECVYDFADAFYRRSGGSIGRGGNALAVAAASVARQAKDNLRKLYSCPAHEVVFTASATDALNRILLGLDLVAGDHVYLTPFEHNAVTRPLNQLTKRSGILLHVLPFDNDEFLPDMEAIEGEFEKRQPKLVVLTHASNVCGAVVPVSDICDLAKRFGATTVVDMSQTAGLIKLNLTSNNIDFAVFAGHKTLYGPFGIGGFFCRKGARLNPVFFGGNGVNSIQQDMPDDIVQMEEIGSQNAYAIAGLKASTEWLLAQGMDAIREKEQLSLSKLLDILDDVPLSIVGSNMKCERIGVLSACFDGYSPDEMEMILGRYGVAIRSGIHCAPYAHDFLGTLPAGTVRFSVSVLTQDCEFALLKDALDEIAESY